MIWELHRNVILFISSKRGSILGPPFFRFRPLGSLWAGPVRPKWKFEGGKIEDQRRYLSLFGKMHGAQAGAMISRAKGFKMEAKMGPQQIENRIWKIWAPTLGAHGPKKGGRENDQQKRTLFWAAQGGGATPWRSVASTGPQTPGLALYRRYI